MCMLRRSRHISNISKYQFEPLNFVTRMTISTTFSPLQVPSKSLEHFYPFQFYTKFQTHLPFQSFFSKLFLPFSKIFENFSASSLCPSMVAISMYIRTAASHIPPQYALKSRQRQLLTADKIKGVCKTANPWVMKGS